MKVINNIRHLQEEYHTILESYNMIRYWRNRDKSSNKVIICR